MSTERQWRDFILDAKTPSDAWQKILETLKDLSLVSISPVELQKLTIPADRMLSEAAWCLWHSFSKDASHTSHRLAEWCQTPSPQGKAILVLDALSLNELSLIIGNAKSRQIEPVRISVSGSETPSDTDSFAKALGVPSRSSFQNNRAPSGFTLFKDDFFTEVMGDNFADCCSSIPPTKNLFIWHTWLDDMIHVYRKTPDQIHSTAVSVFQSDGFWKFVDCLRQGRSLIITGDHGYTNSKYFSSDESDPVSIDIFRNVFGASRCVQKKEPWTHAFMPPSVLSTETHHVVMGQKKWKVQGGFPALCHGGLSLLETAVPFIELSAL